jgi:hypothetical protein
MNIKKINMLIELEFGTEKVLEEVKQKNKEVKVEENNNEDSSVKLSEKEEEILDVFCKETGIEKKKNDLFVEGIREIIKISDKKENVVNAIDLMKRTRKKDGGKYHINSPKSILSFLKNITENNVGRSKVLVIIDNDDE